ncbi:hypothetical protein [Parablautia muri]|uniref:hypothetical protein n=1 Tax=Parablautia muri TaxID=2320879 RepID=UPI00136D6CA9|nr:hypothetical protein [Parablautia muri]
MKSTFYLYESKQIKSRKVRPMQIPYVRMRRLALSIPFYIKLAFISKAMRKDREA